jgi:hypothetical protein
VLDPEILEVGAHLVELQRVADVKEGARVEDESERRLAARVAR